MLLAVAPEVPTPLGAGSPDGAEPLDSVVIIARTAAICGPDFFA
jgi:hypothetical protein